MTVVLQQLTVVQEFYPFYKIRWFITVSITVQAGPCSELSEHNLHVHALLRTSYHYLTWLLPFRYSSKKNYKFFRPKKSMLRHASSISFSLCHHLHSIWRTIQIMKLLNLSCYLSKMATVIASDLCKSRVKFK